MEEIAKLKKEFKKYNLDGYLVPKNDQFFNEYISDFEDNLKYISKFSGSYGLALILKNKNFLFVDGRYTVQANNQSGRYFKILSLPLHMNKVRLNLNNKKIGYNPKLFNQPTINQLSKKLKIDLISIEKDMISLKKNIKKKDFFYPLKDSVTGKNFNKKIKELGKYLKKNHLDIIVVTSSENIAWLLNIRGEDTMFSPIPNCFLIMDKKMNIYLFSDLKKINKDFKKKFKSIKIINIDNISNFLRNIKDKTFSIDESTCSVYYRNIIRKQNHIKVFRDPIYLMKSLKNSVELKNTKKIHEYDGAALTKFLFWIKKNYNKRKITELSAQNKLFEFKKKFKQFKSLSFPTISSTGSNGAIVHYNATKKTNKTLKKGGIYLVDSGGQYYFGTTDVTRTVSLNTKNEKIKKVFTKVLQGHLNLANYKIKKNTTGSVLDKVARKNLKEMNLNYAHGTGHGVGYFLNVHEGPQSISSLNRLPLKPGMILSNEPGYYEKGKFGLRIENLIYVKKNNNNIKFENLTFAPIDKNLIVKKLLKKKEIVWLNDYHREVYKKLRKYMNKEELEFLKNSCSNI